MTDLTHLAEGYRERALRPDTERIAWIRQDRWLGFPKAETVRTTLQTMLDYPTRTRMPCLLVYGQTGMGKTRIVERFGAENRAVSMTAPASLPFRSSRSSCHRSPPKANSTGNCSKRWGLDIRAGSRGRKDEPKSAARGTSHAAS